MKLIQITESNQEFRRGLADILINEGAVPLVFEVPDDYDVNGYEGLAVYTPKEQQSSAFKASFPEVAAWLEGYQGTFDFYLSLQRQYREKGMLSDKQIACIQRAIEADQARGVSRSVPTQQNFSMEPGTVLVISKFIANKISQEAGYSRGLRAIEIMSVEAETPKAYRAKVKLSARRTSFCGCCGLTLENPDSIAAGVGPVCADKYGIPYGERSLEELESQLIGTLEVSAWIPKKSIKERINPDGTTWKAKKPSEQPAEAA